MTETKRGNNGTILAIVYLAAVLVSFPILRYILYFTFDLNPDAKDEFAVVRVFLSGPMLVLIGGLLVMMEFKNVYHRVFGMMFMIAGLTWITVIIKTAIDEAA